MNDAEEHDDDLGINLDILGILKRRYHLIALGILLGATLATIFYVMQVPVYESYLSVLVGQRSSELPRTGMNSGAEGAAMMQDEILSSHMELFRSPKILENAIAMSRLDASVMSLSNNLTISKGGEGLAKNASVLKASFRDTDPNAAAEKLQAIYEAFQRYIENQTRNVGSEAAQLIASAQIKNEEELRRADKEYREFVAMVPALVNGSGLDDVHRSRLTAIEAQLGGVREELSNARSQLVVITDFAKDKRPETLTDVQVMSLLNDKEIERVQAFLELSRTRDIDDTEKQRNYAVAQESARTEFAKILDLTSRERLMRAEYGENHPSVKSIRSELDSLRRYTREVRDSRPDATGASAIRPAELLTNYFSVLRRDILELEKREQELIKLSDVESKLAKEVEVSYLKGMALKANLDRAQQRYDEVFKRLQEINLTNDYSGFSTDMIVMPLPAMLPVWPAKAKIAAIGLLLGGMLGFAFAMVAEFADRTFHNPDDVERVVGASILSHVPFLKESLMKKKAKPNSPISPMIGTFHSPRATESETFRVLRTSIMFMNKKQNRKVFLLTSPSPSDGKSTTIANVAVSMAQTGKRVLLVDADLRRPTVAKTFGAERSPGLSDFLNSTSEFNKCLQVCEQPHLVLCTAGSRTSEPSELLESPQFAEFIKQARANFDLIFIDTPPVLAVADPAIVGLHVDGCLMVLRIEKNNRTLVERATGILRGHGVEIDGVIVNARDSRAGGYGYTAYNYYGKKEYGYQAAYRRYYEADAGEEESGKKSKTSRRIETQSVSPEFAVLEDSVNGHAVNGAVSNGHLEKRS